MALNKGVTLVPETETDEGQYAPPSVTLHLHFSLKNKGNRDSMSVPSSGADFFYFVKGIFARV